ncbi:stage III sporulation protein AA [Dysosmobacter sp.]|uniref:stage III sporulation protein AA n=1 Tax=Dysosmobacter sp. TaxID=2591382 RepID=UPI002A8F7F5A|nr:stage III sporulation protein AA [Dysosmobacter sp.]MDY3282629.1 stage III sporulation protein AA [Dysosmobacter sp.]
MEQEKSIICYEQAAMALPGRLRRAAMAEPRQRQAQAEEFRLRAGRTMTILTGEGEWDTGVPVEQGDLEALCNLATEFSRYAAVETLRRGFLSLQGGGRVGLCGSAVMKEGSCANLKDFSSAAIRIPREVTGIGDGLAPRLFREGRFCSTVILSPPGGGKTTLLRDLIRCLSYGTAERPGLRVALADERGEVAVMLRGLPQMDIGPRTDVLEGCPKAEAVPMLLRAMNPQVAAVDEITAREDLRAMTMAANCGVGLLATIHAASVEELRHKPLYAELLAARVFTFAVVIRREAGQRQYQVEELEC